ncbi:MAG: sensor domain-containing protein [Halorubrum sp.]|uniref:sensor domain-containing protein n=1 Tax=Halorubrum sp. TaxID=1879286 RepID=UPI003970BBA4
MASLRSPSTLPVVGVLVDGRTYGNLLYLLLAVPLGFVYSTVFTFGLALGLALSVVLVGLVILLMLLVGSRLVAGFERWLANALLGTDLSRPDDLADGDGALAGVRKYVDARSTWTGLGFLSLKFWVSLFALVPLVVLSSALPLVAAPLRYPYAADFGEVNGEPVTWAVDTLPEALVALALGVAGVLLSLHVANLVAYAARQMAVALLGHEARGASPPESAAGGESHSHEGASPVEADTDPEGGFEFVDDPVDRDFPDHDPVDRDPVDRDPADSDFSDRGPADRGPADRDSPDSDSADRPSDPAHRDGDEVP